MAQFAGGRRHGDAITERVRLFAYHNGLGIDEEAEELVAERSCWGSARKFGGWEDARCAGSEE